eukprot:TRINITY_DN5165_c0_g1_i1.p1 TRINITY_DN5165_c0_g1~~TRINITY_DN5165_c0_g1_i1.p1  ORF type:complete len:215 (+),score=14.16 TRINITY_DN5165_c0_g1_i1:362-1006(+)
MCQRCWQACWVCKERCLLGIARAFFPAPQEVNPELTLPTRTAVVSSLPFQILIYYSRIYSVIWALLTLVSITWKQMRMELDGLIYIYTAVVAIPLEIPRFWMGFHGNLKEKAVEMTGFWAMSVLSMGFTVYFLFGQALVMPLDFAINFLKLLADLSCCSVGYFATRHMMKVQTTRFHVNQFVSRPNPAAENQNPPSPMRQGSPVRRVTMKMGTL